MTSRWNDGLTALFKNEVVQKARSARTFPARSPRIRSQAGAISFCWPGPSSKRTGRPSASTTAWILVPNPPRERPRAWACDPPFFAVRRLLEPEPGSPSRLWPAIRYRDHSIPLRISGRLPLVRSSDNNDAWRFDTDRNAQADHANDHLNAPATAMHSENGGHHCGDHAYLCDRPEQNHAADPTDHHEVSRLPRQPPKDSVESEFVSPVNP